MRFGLVRFGTISEACYDRGFNSTFRQKWFLNDGALDPKSSKMDNCLGVVKESWCRMVGGKGRRGISFAWRQHRFFFDDFLLLALSYEKLEETGKGKE